MRVDVEDRHDGATALSAPSFGASPAGRGRSPSKESGTAEQAHRRPADRRRGSRWPRTVRARRLGHRVDRRAGHAGSPQHVDPRIAPALREDLGDQRQEPPAVLHRARDSVEIGIRDPLGVPERRAKFAREIRSLPTHTNRSSSAVANSWNGTDHAAADIDCRGVWRFQIDERLDALRHKRQRRVEQRASHDAAAAGRLALVERGEQADHRPHPGPDIRPSRAARARAARPDRR